MGCYRVSNRHSSANADGGRHDNGSNCLYTEKKIRNIETEISKCSSHVREQASSTENLVFFPFFLLNLTLKLLFREF